MTADSGMMFHLKVATGYISRGPGRWVGIARQDCSYEPEPTSTGIPGGRYRAGRCGYGSLRCIYWSGDHEVGCLDDPILITLEMITLDMGAVFRDERQLRPVA